MVNGDTMEKIKRDNMINKMNYLLNNEEEKLKEKKRREELLKLEEEARKRRIVVKNILDLKEKYGDYSININDRHKIVTLKKPLEVKYLAQFRYDCKKLGFKCEIDSGNAADFIYYRISRI